MKLKTMDELVENPVTVSQLVKQVVGDVVFDVLPQSLFDELSQPHFHPWGQVVYVYKDDHDLCRFGLPAPLSEEALIRLEETELVYWFNGQACKQGKPLDTEE